MTKEYTYTKNKDNFMGSENRVETNVKTHVIKDDGTVTVIEGRVKELMDSTGSVTELDLARQ